MIEDKDAKDDEESSTFSASQCSTCKYCKICGESGANLDDESTCYSCSVYTSSRVSSSGSCSVYAENKASSSSGAAAAASSKRNLEIISTDSDSSLGSFDSVESPTTAWKRNHEKSTSQQVKQSSKTTERCDHIT